MPDIADFAGNAERWDRIRAERAQREFEQAASAIQTPQQRADGEYQSMLAQQKQEAPGTLQSAAQAAPAPRQRPRVDHLMDYMGDLIKVAQEHGKLTPDFVMKADQMVKSAKAEGFHDALNSWEGGDAKAGEAAFNNTGQGRIKVLSLKPAKFSVGDKSYPTNEVEIQHVDESGNPYGAPSKINVGATMFATISLQDRIKMAQEESKLASERIKAEADRTKAGTEARGGASKPTDLMQNVQFIKASIPGIDEREAISIAQGKSDTFSATSDMLGGMSLHNKFTGETWTFDRNGKETGHSPAKSTLRNPGNPASKGIDAPQKSTSQIDWSKY